MLFPCIYQTNITRNINVINHGGHISGSKKYKKYQKPSHRSATIINNNGTINLGDVGRVDLHEVVQVLHGHLAVDCHPVHLAVQAVQ